MIKKVFVRVLSSTSQRGGKTNRIPFRSVVLVLAGMANGQYKGRWPSSKFFISTMSNIIPLPFKSTLSASYADVSELAQAMQCLERHLAHVVNI